MPRRSSCRFVFARECRTIATLRNATTGIELAPSVERARSIFARAIGCLKYAQLERHEGLWLEPCSAIHTFGMRTSLDVILLDRNRAVVALRFNVKPNQPYIAHRRAKMIVEMGPGFLDSAAIAIGDTLELAEHSKDARPRPAFPIISTIVDESGGTLVEYSLVVSLIAVAAFSAVAVFGTNLRNLYTEIANHVGSA